MQVRMLRRVTIKSPPQKNKNGNKKNNVQTSKWRKKSRQKSIDRIKD